MNAVSERAAMLLAGGLVETISLKVVDQGFAIATIRFRDVHLQSLGVIRRPDGSLKLRFPKIISRGSGRDHGLAYAVQPCAEARVKEAIRALWERIEAGRAHSDVE